MGLDMYLHASKYVSGYSHQHEERQEEYQALVDLFPDVSGCLDESSPSATVEFTVGYWRKANHIHSWFVENVQGGEDECKPHYVSREKLQELRELCLRVLALPTKQQNVIHNVLESDGKIVEKPAVATIITAQEDAEELLPTAAGFFFGDTTYGEWYRQDTEDTVKIIDSVLELSDEWDFEYQSSW